MSLQSPARAIDRAYSNAELIADGLIHAAALVAGAVGFCILFAEAPLRGGFGEHFAMAVYAGGFFLLFGFSFAYNMAPPSPLKTILGRCDRSAIFVMIAGTYTALLSQTHGGLWVAALGAFVWSGAIGGVALTVLRPRHADRIAVALYLGLGWSAILAIRPLVLALPTGALALVLLGGALYSVGVAFFLWRSLKFQNAIWHAFVTIAAACHFVGVLEAVTGAV
jgi:hemolysin III